MRRTLVIDLILLAWGLIWAGAWILGVIRTEPPAIPINPLAVLLIFGTIGILRKQEWARQMLIIWASIILLFSFISYYLVDLSCSKTFLETLKVLIPIIPCVLILYFFTYRPVKEQFIERQKSNVQGVSLYTKFLITVVNFLLIFFFFSLHDYLKNAPPGEKIARSIYYLSTLIPIVYPFILNFVVSRFIKDRMARYRFLFRQFLGLWLFSSFAYLGTKSEGKLSTASLAYSIAGYSLIFMIIFLISRMFVWIQGKKANVQIKSKIIGDNK